MKKINKNVVGVLIKFVEEKYVQSTLNGQLFFTSPTYFKEHEAKYKDDKMGDVYDPDEPFDKYLIKADSIFTLLPEKNYPIRLPVDSVSIKFNVVKSYGICSFMYLRLRDFEKVDCADAREKAKKDINPSKTFKLLKLKSEVIEQLKTFQKIEEKDKRAKCRPLLFLNNEFFSCISNSEHAIGYGLVKYHDFHNESDPNKIPDYQNQSDVMVLFNKDKSYSGQREYRLVKNIQKGVKGEEFSYPELKGHIIKSSIPALSELRLCLEYKD